ncbi:cytochrome c oxidase assembly factor Coa1 family protein [Acidihalobacter prosperus]
MDNSENTSGFGKKAHVPSDIRGWNWGAFFLNWIWGIGNSTYIAFLMFVPLVNLVMPFVLGAKGNEWAWRNRTWRSIEQFKKTQRRWAWSGFLVILLIPLLIAFPFFAMKFSDAYSMSLRAVKNNNLVIKELGKPLRPGFFVTGSFSTSSSNAIALLQYSITGPKGTGEVSVYAVKHAGHWHLQQVLVHAFGRHIVVVGGSQANKGSQSRIM